MDVKKVLFDWDQSCDWVLGFEISDDEYKVLRGRGGGTMARASHFYIKTTILK